VIGAALKTFLDRGGQSWRIIKDKECLLLKHDPIKDDPDMRDDLDKHFVRSLLLNMRFDVELIPEASDYKTPDLKVIMPEGDILVEVKSKEDDKQVRDFLKSPEGNVLTYNEAAAKSALRDAWHQIRDFPDRKEEDLRLIWFITRKERSVTFLVKDCIKTLLYGIENISGQKVDRKVFDRKPCYFFNESFFHRYKDLDGVVLHEDELGDQLVELCLNPFSTRYNHYKTFKMKLTEFFQNRFSLTDPRKMDASGECFLADCNISRQDKNGIVRYLKSKYELDTVTIEKIPIINVPVD
jgi:hypothetical protein